MTYYERNKEKCLKNSLKYYRKNKDKINKAKRDKRRNNPNFKEKKYISEEERHLRKEKGSELKRKILDHYGKKCACCGEDNIAFLTVDHINNNGKEHGNGKNRYKGAVLYAHLIALGYPEDIQILCFNCNIGRRNNGGICPHKEVKSQ